MNIIYAGAAYPAGRWSDRIDKPLLLAFGLLVLIASNLALATASNLILVAVGVALWGLHMAITQGLFVTLVAAAAPAELRGTAFGMFNLVAGVAMLGASILAGALWNSFGPATTFFASAILTGVGFIPLLLLGHQKKISNQGAAFSYNSCPHGSTADSRASPAIWVNDPPRAGLMGDRLWGQHAAGQWSEEWNGDACSPNASTTET